MATDVKTGKVKTVQGSELNYLRQYYQKNLTVEECGYL